MQIVSAKNHESWVVPAGVSSALAVLGGEIPSRIDSSTIWGGGQTVEESIFLLARGVFLLLSVQHGGEYISTLYLLCLAVSRLKGVLVT